MTYPVADEEQEIDMALHAAAYSRWVELREQRKPGDAERHDCIRASLMGEELRWHCHVVREVAVLLAAR
jgi:hypothetical protein